MADFQLFDWDARSLDALESFDPVIPTYTISRGADGTIQFDPPFGDEDLAIALSYHFPRPKTLDEKMQAAMLKFLQDSTRLSNPLIHTTSTEIPNENVWQGQPRNPMLVNEGTLPRPTISPNTPSLPELDSVLSTVPTEGIVRLADETKGSPSTTSQTSSTSIQNWHITVPSSSQRLQMLGVLDSKTGMTQKRRTRRKYGTLESKQVFDNRGNACERHRRTKSKCDRMKCPNNKLFRPSSSPEVQSFSSQTQSDLSLYGVESEAGDGLGSQTFLNGIDVGESDFSFSALIPKLVTLLELRHKSSWDELILPRRPSPQPFPPFPLPFLPLLLPPFLPQVNIPRKRKSRRIANISTRSDDNDDEDDNDGSDYQNGGSGDKDFSFDSNQDGSGMDGPDKGHHDPFWGASSSSPDCLSWQAAFCWAWQVFALANAVSLQQSVEAGQSSRHARANRRLLLPLGLGLLLSNV